MRLLLPMLFAACSPAYPPELPLAPEYTECAVDGDCMMLELGCCDACNGGVAVAVRRDSAEEVDTLFGERPCRRTSCTLMDCPDNTATCDQGTCTAVPGTFDE